MKYFRLLLVSSVMSMLLVLTVVGPKAASAAKPGDTLVVAQLFNPIDMSPWNYTALATVDIWEHFMEPLTRIDRQGQVQGVVVESWEMVSPAEWILHIRKGMKFHDPKYGELTAEDVKYSIDRSGHKDEVVSRLLPEAIKQGSTEVIDQYTLRWKLAAPGLGSLPNWMAILHATSKAYVEGEGKEVFKQRPMGAGPYKFVEWVTNQRVVGQVFEEYWGPRPGFDRIEWRILPDPLTAKNSLLAGEVDVFQFVPPEVIPEVEKNPGTRIETTPSARMLFMVINASEPPLDNKLVRQGLNYAVDKKAIAEQLYRGYAIPLRTTMQETIPELNKELQGYSYNPDKARELLKQGGYNGEKIKLGAPIGRYTLDKELGEAVAGMLEEVGVNVEYKPAEWGTYAPPLFKGEASGINLIGMGNVVLLPQWVFTLWLLPGGQGEVYTKGRPENWKQDIDEVSILAREDPRRQQLLNKLQAEALDFAPWIFLVNLKDVYGLSNKIEWQPYPTETRIFIDAKPR